MECSFWKGKGIYNIIYEKKYFYLDLLIIILKLVFVMFNKDNFDEICLCVGSFYVICKFYGEKKILF